MGRISGAIRNSKEGRGRARVGKEEDSEMVKTAKVFSELE